MATIKSYSDLEQSRKLAKILPLESADMVYICIDMGRKWINVPRFTEDVPDHTDDYDICAWSLAALLSVLPKIVNNETLFIETSAALWHIGYRNIYTARADNPVDACYEMILKLHELKML